VEEFFLNQDFKRSLQMVQGFQQNYQKTPERFNRVMLRYCFGVENDYESGECTTETESQENITIDGDVTDLSRARLSFSIGPAVATRKYHFLSVKVPFSKHLVSVHQKLTYFTYSRFSSAPSQNSNLAKVLFPRRESFVEIKNYFSHLNLPSLLLLLHSLSRH
jgi:hypothetical protein